MRPANETKTLLRAFPLKKSLWGRLAFLTWLVAMALPTVAQAGSMSHEYYSRGRSPYGSHFYVSQQAHYMRSNTLADAWAEASDGGSSGVTGDYRGHALQTSLGFEHFRFVQTGLFYSNANISSVEGNGDGFSGHEFGAEARIVLTSPVVNVGLGGGAFLTRKEMERGLERSSLHGTGYRAGLDFTYFVSPRVSLVASVAQSVEQLANRSRDAVVQKVDARSMRAGGGIAIWL